jgi:hypothetical protein
MLLGVILARVMMAASAEGVRVIPAVANFESIFLAEIIAAKSEQDCDRTWDRCKTAVRVRVVQILADHKKQGLMPGEFGAEILQWRGAPGDNPYFWSYRKVRIGQRYLVFSNRIGSYSDKFRSPANVEPVSDEADSVGDVKLILISAKLPLREEADAVTAALYGGGVAHGPIMAGFIADLLLNGNESNTALLTQAVVEAQTGSLSPSARQSLLYGLFAHLRADTATSDRLFELFVRLTTRYFLDEAAPTSGKLTALQGQVLNVYAGWIAGSARATNAMRTTVEPLLRRQLRQRIQDLSAGGHLTPEEREQARRLLGVVGPN